MDEVQVLKTGCLKAHLLACLLALFVSGCAMAPATHGATPRIRQRGAEIIIIKDGRTHYFENRLPHCLAYTLAGEWEFAIQEAALRTPDRRHFVGLSVFATDTLPGPEGDPVSRAIAYFQAEVEKDWGWPVPSTVEPFPASHSGAILLQFNEVTMTSQAVARVLGPEKPNVGQTVRITKRVLAPFLAGSVMVVAVGDVTDARQVLDTLELTEHPRCWEPTIRERFPGVLR